MILTDDEVELVEVALAHAMTNWAQVEDEDKEQAEEYLARATELMRQIREGR